MFGGSGSVAQEALTAVQQIEAQAKANMNNPSRYLVISSPYQSFSILKVNTLPVTALSIPSIECQCTMWQ
jgi:hypothetical protein